MTRWERFAKEKGIHKTKKTRMVYDDASGDMLPRWGYGAKQNDPMTNWLIEVPNNAGKTKRERERARK